MIKCCNVQSSYKNMELTVLQRREQWAVSKPGSWRALQSGLVSLWCSNVKMWFGPLPERLKTDTRILLPQKWYSSIWSTPKRPKITNTGRPPSTSLVVDQITSNPRCQGIIIEFINIFSITGSNKIWLISYLNLYEKFFNEYQIFSRIKTIVLLLIPLLERFAINNFILFYCWPVPLVTKINRKQSLKCK